jgi:hypothetical protein
MNTPQCSNLTETKTIAIEDINHEENKDVNHDGRISDCTAESIKFFQGPFVPLESSLGSASTTWESKDSAFSLPIRQSRSNSGATDVSDIDTMIPMWNPSCVKSPFLRVNSVVSMSEDVEDITGGTSTDSNDTTGTGHFSNSPTMMESMTPTRTTVGLKGEETGDKHLVDLCDEVASYYLFSPPDNANTLVNCMYNQN